MKKQLIALAVATATLGFSAAQAADVEIYGRIDSGLKFQKTKSADHATVAMTHGNSTPRIGLNITETINEDLMVKVYLENGFKGDSGALGTANVLFDRRSILALKSKSYGEFAFGRMGTVASTMAPYTMGLIKFDPFGTAYADDCSIGQAFANSSRANNAFTYISPKLAGWTLGATYSLSVKNEEAAPVSNNDRVLALALNYSNGPLYVTAAGSSVFYKSTSTYKDAREYQLGATYNFGVAKLYAIAQYFENQRAMKWSLYEKKTDAGDTSTADTGLTGYSLLLGTRVPVTERGDFIASVMYQDSHQDDIAHDFKRVDGKRTIVAMGYEHSLSKSLIAYASLSYSKGSGGMSSHNLSNQVNADGKKATDLNRTTSYIGLRYKF